MVTFRSFKSSPKLWNEFLSPWKLWRHTDDHMTAFWLLQLGTHKWAVSEYPPVDISLLNFPGLFNTTCMAKYVVHFQIQIHLACCFKILIRSQWPNLINVEFSRNCHTSFSLWSNSKHVHLYKDHIMAQVEFITRVINTPVVSTTLYFIRQ